MKQTATAILVLCIICSGVMLSAQQTLSKPTEQHLPLVPEFDTSQNAPLFHVTFKNETTGTANVYRLYTASSVRLDGKTYSQAYNHTVFQGDPDLQPGGQWSYHLDLSEYVPGWKRLDYDKGRQAWCWQTPLATGMHTIALEMGGKQYGPVDFFWDEDRA